MYQLIGHEEEFSKILFSMQRNHIVSIEYWYAYNECVLVCVLQSFECTMLNYHQHCLLLALEH